MWRAILDTQLDLEVLRIDVHGLINGALTGAGAVPDDGPIDDHVSLDRLTQ